MRGNPIGFSIGGKGYIGTGFDGSYLQKDFWEYDCHENAWTPKTGFGAVERTGAIGFSIGGKGYVGTGFGNTGSSYPSDLKDFWEYDPSTNVWTQKADFGGGNRSFAVGFSIGRKGYIGTGNYQKDFWEYNPSANIWTRKTDFGGPGRSDAVGFSIGNKGYIGTGYDPNDPNYYKKDFWEYDPATNAWTRKANFKGTERVGAVGFSIGNKGYIGTGYDVNITNKKDFWEYDPSVNVWVKKADFAGKGRYNAVGFSIGRKGYIGTGFGEDTLGYSSNKNDFWEYNQFTDNWTRKADFGGIGRSEATGFSIGRYGYIGFGTDFFKYYNDWWQYTPSGVSPVQSITFNASLQKTNALLSWQTTNDVNTSYFNIQRSLDGVNFTTIAKQDARGDIVQQYPYTDANVTALLHEKIFYRLQSMHKDSSSAYSNIAELNINNSNGITFFIYPNPVKDKLHININCRKNETFSIRIVDMNGRQVYTEKITSLANNFNHYINVGKLAMGIYTIQLLNGKGVSKTSFVKEL